MRSFTWVAAPAACPLQLLQPLQPFDVFHGRVAQAETPEAARVCADSRHQGRHFLRAALQLLAKMHAVEDQQARNVLLLLLLLLVVAARLHGNVRDYANGCVSGEGADINDFLEAGGGVHG